jgi:Zn-dependent protease with chaperone function
MRSDSAVGELGHALVRVGQMWAAGWFVLLKSVVAVVIVLLFASPLSWLLTALQNNPDLRGGVALVALALGFFVYLPLVFYVAGSWLGFCRYVTPPAEDAAVEPPRRG